MTTKQTGSIISNVSNPFKGSKYIGLFFTVLAILGSLGLAYYFKIESNRNNYREYHFRTLDALEDRFDRLVKNRKQELAQMEGLESDSSKYLDAVEAFFDSNEVSKLLKDLPWNESFEGLVVSQEGANDSAIVYHSFNSNLKLKHLVSKQDTINGLEKNVKLLGREYRIFSKNYASQDLKLHSNQGKYDSYTFYGLVTWEEYASTNLRLDVWLIILLATALLLIIIGLPLLKLLFISDIERLFRRDVVLAGVSVIVGTPILFLVFLSIFQYGRYYYQEVPNQLSELSQKVEDRFIDENDKVVRQLYNLRLNFNELTQDKRKISQNSDKYYRLDEGVNLTEYNDFKQVAKVSASGDVGKQLIRGQVISPRLGRVINLKNRPYFQDWEKGNLSSVGVGNLDYVMRPVLSLEEGTEEAVYLIPFEGANGKTENTDLMIAGVNLSSVHQPILPTGYDFAIINSLGEVWFHSLPGRSTLENFYNSTLDENQLKSVIDGNISTSMYLSYMGRSHIAHVNPINGSDLYVITLYDTELLKLQTSGALSLGSLGILAAFLVTCFLTFVTIYLRRRKSNFYKYKKFQFRFLEPHSENRMGYTTLILFFSIIIIITIVLVYVNDLAPKLVFMINMLLMVWAYIFVYYRFNILKRYKVFKDEPDVQEDGGEALKSSRSSAKTLGTVSEKIGDKSLKPGFADFIIILFVLALNTFIIREGAGNGGAGQVSFLIIIQILVLLMMFFAIFTVDGLNSALSWVKVNPEKATYKRLYIWFLFLWLCVNSIIPAFSFFNESSQVERLIWQKKSQLDMSRAFDQKYVALDTVMNFAEDVKEKKLIAHLKNSVYQVDSVKSSGVVPGRSSYEYEVHKSNFKKLLFKIRPIYDEKVSNTQALIFDAPDNNKWLWSSKDKQLNFRYRLENIPGQDYQTIYQLPDKNLPIFLQGSDLGKVVMILLIIGVLLSIFYLVVFFARKIFGFAYSNYRPNDFLTSDNLTKLRRKMGDQDNLSNLAIVGLPNSGKMELALKLLSSTKRRHVATVSCLNILDDGDKVTMECQKVTSTLGADGLCHYQPDGNMGTKTVADLAVYDVLIIESFEHGYQSHEENGKKLKLLKELLDQGKQLVLLTDIYPSQVLSFYRRQIHNSPEPNEDHKKHFNAWHNVFGSFTDVLHGFNKDELGLNKTLDIYEATAGQIKQSARDVIIKELAFGNYLPKLAEPVMALTEKTEYVKVAVQQNGKAKKSLFKIAQNNKEARVSVDTQEFYLQVESLARGYYANIWNSLATRERFIVYDLAKDGFVNIKNGAALFSLMKKGVVIWREKPILFNRSFRNFIISSISKEEAQAMKKMIRKNGSWGFTKTILYMVMIGLVGFLVIGEPQFVNDLQTFVGVLAGIATVVPVLSSFIGAKRTGG